jgi:hypothetical protein
MADDSGTPPRLTRRAFLRRLGFSAAVLGLAGGGRATQGCDVWDTYSDYPDGYADGSYGDYGYGDYGDYSDSSYFDYGDYSDSSYFDYGDYGDYGDSYSDYGDYSDYSESYSDYGDSYADGYNDG